MENCREALKTLEKFFRKTGKVIPDFSGEIICLLLSTFFPREIHGKRVKILSLPGVYIGGDVLYRFGVLAVHSDAIFHYIQRIDDCGVVLFAELLGDVALAEFGQAADQIHGDLTGIDHLGGFDAASQSFFFNVKVFADGGDNAATL